ncbi:hypothetical protein ABK040_008775 [Willaertia magna]
MFLNYNPSFDHSIFQTTKDLTINTDKSPNTGLCWIPKPLEDTENWKYIQQLRLMHQKGVRSPPHIHFLFPFVTECYFEQAFQLLSEKLKDFPSFEITFSSFNKFNQNSSNCIIYLEPDKEAKVKFKELYKKIEECFPYCKKKVSYEPHMTVGFFKKEEVELKKKQILEKWKPITVKIEEISMIYRPLDNAPFSIVYKIPLLVAKESLLPKQ